MIPADTQMKELRASLAKMELVFGEIDEAVVWINKKGFIQWCNRQFDLLLGMSHISILGKSIFEVMQEKDIDFLMLNQKSDEKKLTLATLPDGWSIEDFSFVKEGVKLILNIRLRKFVAPEEKELSYIILIRDVTETKKLMDQLERLAHYDILTNLPNRTQLYTYLKREIAYVKRHNTKLGLLFIDFDKFKMINDKYGHAVGDLFLKNVADRLNKCIRKEDFVARLGGDEFVVVIRDLEKTSSLNETAKKILQRLSDSYNLAGNEVKMSASIGASICPDDSNDEDSLIHMADEAMYKAKKEGGNSFGSVKT